MATTPLTADAVISNVEQYLEKQFNERLQVVEFVKPSALQPHDKQFICLIVLGSALLGALIPLVMK